MPTRSLSTSVLKWPDRSEVDRAVRKWAACQAEERPELLKVGYFGSYARGDWGVGSDLDLFVIVAHSDLPFERRAISWDTSTLPVAAELIIYTATEWQHTGWSATRFVRTIREQTVWVFGRQDV